MRRRKGAWRLNTDCGQGRRTISGTVPDSDQARGCSISAADRDSPPSSWRRGSAKEARVLAVDESVRFIGRLTREAKRLGFEQITTRVERAEMLRLEPSSLDGAFVRWLFCFLSDPATVVNRVVNGLRPGGRLVAWDFLNYDAMTLLPRSPAFERVRAAVYESFAGSGGDLNIGGRLPGLVAASGCRLVDLVPLVRFIRPGTSFWKWPTQFFSNYVPQLVETGFLTDSDRLAFEAEWRDRERDPGTFLFAPPVIGIVAEKM